MRGCVECGILFCSCCGCVVLLDVVVLQLLFARMAKLTSRKCFLNTLQAMCTVTCLAVQSCAEGALCFRLVVFNHAFALLSLSAPACVKFGMEAWRLGWGTCLFSYDRTTSGSIYHHFLSAFGAVPDQSHSAFWDQWHFALRVTQWQLLKQSDCLLSFRRSDGGWNSMQL